MTRITYMGKQVYPKPHRNSKGQFARKAKRALFLAFLVAGAGIIFLFAPQFDKWLSKEIEAKNPVTQAVAAIVPVAKAGETTEAKIEDLKESILDRLSKCESAGHKEEDGIAILDTNDKGSYGPFQFQRKTVMYYYEKMTGTRINGRDAIILALQGDKARELARFVIFKTDAGVSKDWVNCARQLDLQKEVDIIKQLQS